MVMAGGVTYAAVPFRAFPIDRRHALLTSPALDAVKPVIGAVPAILAACAVPRTLEAHEAAVLARVPGADVSFVRSTLDSLVRAGLLSPSPQAGASDGPSIHPITTAAVTTADRPDRLERCLNALLEHLTTRGRRLRVLVADDSHDAGNQAQNENIGRSAAARFGCRVDYLGSREKAALRERLAAVGTNQTALAYAFPSASPLPSPGANRNAVLLATAGERVLLLEDTTIAKPWRGSGTKEGLDLCGHADPRRHRFFETRAAALPEGAAEDLDLVMAHETVIGRPLSALVHGANGFCDTGSACMHVLAKAVETDAHARIRIAMSGVAGDAGLDCPYRLLLRDGGWKTDMRADRDVFDAALTFREMERIVDRLSVTHDPGCELYCAAIDNTTLVPPFFPIGSGGAELFGLMLAACDSDALFAHLPVGIVRDTPCTADYEGSTIVSASTLRITDLVAAILSTCWMPPFRAAVPERLRRMDEHIQAITALDPGGFRDAIRAVIIERRAQELLRIESMEVPEAGFPPFWNAALARYRATVLEVLEDPTFCCPVEIHRIPDPTECLEVCRVWLDDFAALLHAWPDLWRAAREIGADHSPMLLRWPLDE